MDTPPPLPELLPELFPLMIPPFKVKLLLSTRTPPPS
jgi:hypothetical protein